MALSRSKALVSPNGDPSSHIFLLTVPKFFFLSLVLIFPFVSKFVVVNRINTTVN